MGPWAQVQAPVCSRTTGLWAARSTYVETFRPTTYNCVITQLLKVLSVPPPQRVSYWPCDLFWFFPVLFFPYCASWPNLKILAWLRTGQVCSCKPIKQLSGTKSASDWAEDSRDLRFQTLFQRLPASSEGSSPKEKSFPAQTPSKRNSLYQHSSSPPPPPSRSPPSQTLLLSTPWAAGPQHSASHALLWLTLS